MIFYFLVKKLLFIVVLFQGKEKTNKEADDYSCLFLTTTLGTSTLSTTVTRIPIVKMNSF